jgi:hypothetical protein
MNNNFDIYKNSFNLWGNINNAKNMKVNSDLRNLTSKIVTTWAKWFNLEGLVLEWNKINFKQLGENEENFKNPYWDDYLIFVKDNSFQVYWTIIDENWNKIAIIRWDYYPKNDNDPKSLVEINWKIIENWDILEKVEDKVEKISWEFNIETDLRNGKDNINILYILKEKEKEKEFVNFSLESIWKVEYKKQEIKAPKDFIKMEDGIWIY